MNDFHLCTLESAWSGLVSMSALPGPLMKHLFYSSNISHILQVIVQQSL